MSNNVYANQSDAITAARDPFEYCAACDLPFARDEDALDANYLCERCAEAHKQDTASFGGDA